MPLGVGNIEEYFSDIGLYRYEKDGDGSMQWRATHMADQPGCTEAHEVVRKKPADEQNCGTIRQR